ncbi:hypothetical protein ACFO3J_08400 [Streptomyces polygonati]|uniref:Secreted protein n=1 Tax=Streptomyces polygonati TaxID=1617087 RepID=A0ABV8HK26_9ACTN
MTTPQITTRPVAAGGSPEGLAGRAPRPELYRPARRRTGRPGPRRLGIRAVVALILLGTLCALAVVGSVAARRDADALRTTVTERAAVAGQLRFALADLDAQRADTLAPGQSAVSPTVEVGNELVALITAQQRRAQVSDLLRQLGADATQGTQVRALLDALGRYDDLSGRAAYVDEQNTSRLAGFPPPIAVSMNVQAGEVMRDDLLPAASSLFAAYQKQAAQRQDQVHDATSRWALAVGLLGLLTLALLLWWQRELARDYRRLLSLPLVGATAAVLAVSLAGTLALTSCASDVNTAVGQGLRPWTRLAEARAVAAQAAATESRWFVHDSAFGAADAAQFTELTERLDALLTPDGYASAAERPAYEDVLTRYGHFRADDRRLRTLKAAGRTDKAAADEAAKVLTEVGRGDVAFDFWDFATTLDSLAGRQLADFSAHATDARGSLDGWPAVPAGALGLAGVLVLLAVRPRLAEYR